MSVNCQAQSTKMKYKYSTQLLHTLFYCTIFCKQFIAKCSKSHHLEIRHKIISLEEMTKLNLEHDDPDLIEIRNGRY